jgi:hypothetical protein
MTPTTLKESSKTPIDELDESGKVYGLNHSLGLPPWSPPSVFVWKWRRDPAAAKWHGPTDFRVDFDYVLRLLKELHVEHKRRSSDD